MRKSIYIAFTVFFALAVSMQAQSQNSVVVVPLGGDDADAAIVYTGNAPITVVTNEPNATGTISFDVNAMPVLPANKLPVIDLHQPSLGVNCVVAITGVFPSRNGANPYLGEMLYVGFNFAPRGWLSCNGQILSINQNQSLYSLFGTTYGGDGRTTFGLPDLRGRVPVHAAGGQGPGLPNWRLGERFGRTSE